MTTQASYLVEDRILQLFRHLGIEQAHFAACMPRDWGGLVASHPDIVSSLTFVPRPPGSWSSLGTRDELPRRYFEPCRVCPTPP